MSLSMKNTCLLIVVSLVWPHFIQATFWDEWWLYQYHVDIKAWTLAPNLKNQKSSLKSKLIAKNQGNRIQNDSVFQNLSLEGSVSPPSLGHSNEPPRWTHKGQYGAPQKELCKTWEPWTFMPTAKFLKMGTTKFTKSKYLKIPDWSWFN